MDDWRILLYPLGFIPNIAFGLRFLLQWLQSERKGESIVSPLFWYLSIVGNVLFMLHAFIQMQYPICLIQGCNAVLSWRNLNLFHGGANTISRQTVIGILVTVIATITGAFFFQEGDQWMRIPTAPWQVKQDGLISLQWHLIGTLGFILFSSRFWIQWWMAENAKKSYLPESFWWVSLSGAVFILAYSIRINDSVNIIGPSIGLIPYLRNLMLIRKSRLETAKS